ncbi:GNS1/SUR4 family [Nesidiocoris tenuis]|uniref:Elongation of very long chain fatty acids protein n=1 Tax=Nesidiocoris tenuis TaxID=355587 RepID=A0ABN7BCZ9_9HEMI|nr:GNS1/SUR4 family [Nesidiocoris tenuis]
MDDDLGVLRMDISASKMNPTAAQMADHILYNSTSEELSAWWDFLFHELADQRTSEWPLMDNPLPTLVILLLYLYFVLNLGPRIMEKRKPFELKNVLIVYNFIQVLVSTWIVWEAFDTLWLNKYSMFRCESVDWSKTPYNMRICRGFYVYYIAKLSELLDTVFFVMRKKDNQITFLHLYHHTGMPMMAWSTTKYYPGGHAAFIGTINSFVHVVMYSYYMLAAMGPEIQKYLWWKKWLTSLQLGQFCLAFIHYTQVLFHDCNYPKWTVIIVLPNAIFFYYLFWEFYQKAYNVGNKKPVNGSAKTVESAAHMNGHKLKAQ